MEKNKDFKLMPNPNYRASDIAIQSFSAKGIYSSPGTGIRIIAAGIDMSDYAQDDFPKSFSISTTGAYATSVMSVTSVTSGVSVIKLNRFETIKNLFNKVSSSQKKNLDYCGHYIAFLLGQISEEEFENISETFAVTLQNEITDEVIDMIEVLFSISKENYSPSDLSNFFNISENAAEKIINKLIEEKIITISAS
jgi:hypothetical protein